MNIKNNNNCAPSKPAKRRQLEQERGTPVDMTCSTFSEEIFGYLLEREI
jgi:hypothetical protein